jgi:hypothetical protein
MSYVQRYYRHKLVQDIDPQDVVDVETYRPIEGQFNYSDTLIDFCRAVAKKIRGVKFAASNHYTMDVYYPQDKFVLGQVGHGAVMKTSFDERYFVYSRLVRNEKYGYGDKHFFTRMRSSLAPAVKCASALLRSYSDAEHLNASFPKLSRAIDTRRNDAQEALGSSRREVVMNSDRLLQELKNAIQSGYQFTDPEFQHAILTWSSNAEAYTKLNVDKVATYFVEVSSSGLFNVQHIADSTGVQVDLHKQQPHKVYNEETLPEYIAGKLAVLSMVAPEHFVDGVGMRVDGDMFYVVAE